VLRAALGVCAAAAVPRARACEAFATTLRVIHPWSRATREGVTTAAVCMVIDEVTEDDRLIGATTSGASSVELAGEGLGPALDLFVPKGTELVLEESGVHLRLVGLKQQLLLGRSFPLQLQFEKGGTVYSTLNVDQLPLRAASAAGG
jgi:copper(I)-binding protein